MRWLILLFLLTFTISSHAVDSRQLSDPKQQESYETLTKELRCLVCQNQTIADSNAELASDLRRQVYEMLQQGKSGKPVRAGIVVARSCQQPQSSVQERHHQDEQNMPLLTELDLL